MAKERSIDEGDIMLFLTLGFTIWLTLGFLSNVGQPLGYSTTGHIQSIRSYHGDSGAVYESLNITTDNGKTFTFEVKCDYYHVGDNVTVTGYDQMWILPPFKVPVSGGSGRPMISPYPSGCQP